MLGDYQGFLEMFKDSFRRLSDSKSFQGIYDDSWGCLAMLTHPWEFFGGFFEGFFGGFFGGFFRSHGPNPIKINTNRVHLSTRSLHTCSFNSHPPRFSQILPDSPRFSQILLITASLAINELVTKSIHIQPHQ